MALSTTQYGYIIDPMVPFTDDKGKTIKNGFVRVFVAGSSTPVVTYRNFDGATNSDRIELDNSGRTKTSVIGSKGLTYKVCVYDQLHSQESPILTVDKVSVIGANITAGSGATVVTGLDGLTTKPDGFVDASIVGTDGYVALDHTLVDDDLDTDAKVTAVEDDRYIPLLNDDVNDPDSKMTLGRLWQWVLGKIKSLPTTITSFRTGDVIPVDGPSGTAKMSKDSLLAVTADYINTGKNDAFSTSTSTEGIVSAPNTANVSVAGNVLSIDLNKTTSGGYVGCTAQLATNATLIKGNRLFFEFKNSSASPCTFEVLLTNNAYSWGGFYVGVKSVSIAGNGIGSVDYDFSQYASSFGANGVYLCVRVNDTSIQHITLSCRGGIFDIKNIPNVGKAYDVLRLFGKNEQEFNEMYPKKSDIGKLDAIVSNAPVGMITNNSAVNPVTASINDNTLYVDLNKTTSVGYVGASVRLASNASTIKDSSFVFRIENTSANSCTFEILLMQYIDSWGGIVAGMREVSIGANDHLIVEYDFSQYASTFGANSVYLCVRVNDTSIQHITLSMYGYRFPYGEIPYVGKAYDTYRFNGRTYEEANAEIGAKKFKPDEIFTNSVTTLYTAGSSVTASASNGIVSAKVVYGSSGYAGFIVKITDNAQDLKTIKEASLIIRNVGANTSIRLAMVSNAWNWGTGTFELGTYSIVSQKTLILKLDLENYVASLGSGFAGVAFQFMTTDTTSEVEAELAKESGLLNPVNYALDAGMVDGKPISNYVGGQYITCWGDSLTAQGGWTTLLGTLSGRTVYNCGVGGESSPVIMARQGGDVMMLLTNDNPNIVIPGTTTAVELRSGSLRTFFGKDVMPLLQGGGNVNPVTLAGIKGTLSLSASKYYFTRSEAGEAKAIDRDARIITKGDSEYNNPHLMIIYMGQNLGWSTIDELIEQHKKMIAHAKAKHVLVLGLSSGTTASRADYEAAMKAEFGRYFLSIRQYLAHPIYDSDNNIVSCYGLADEGLSPTSDDLDKIAIGQVPSQLLADSVHYTDATKTIIGNMIFKYCQDLGIL